MSWIGIGSTQGWVFHRRTGRSAVGQQLMQRAGVVGGRLPRLTSETLELGPGDVVILATDGLSPLRSVPETLPHEPQRVAERILEQGQRRDDAMVLVARFLVEARS